MTAQLGYSHVLSKAHKTYVNLDQYHPSYLKKIISLFHLMSNHYLPMYLLRRQSTSC